MRKLGKSQHEVLRALREHKRWSSTFPRWEWGTKANTEKVLQTLVKHGLVAVSLGSFNGVEGATRIYEPKEESS